MPKYDIACIGAGIAGLTAAALLTKAGRSVCLMDPGDSAGGCVAASEIDGFRFTSGPTITYGFEPGGILQSLFSDLDLSSGATSSFPGYQVVIPEHRITVSEDSRETLEELVREFPKEISGLSRLYQEVHRLSQRRSKSRLSSFILRQRSAAAFLRSYQFSSNITTYFDVQVRYFFGSSLRHLPLASLVLMLTTAPHYLPGGFTRLADQLLSFVQQQNGTWYHGEPFPEILSHTNKINGIKTSSELIEPRSVILNVPDTRADSIVFLGIRNDVIPIGMLSNVLGLAEVENPDAYYTLSLSPGDDKRFAPPGMRSLTAVFPPAEAMDKNALDSFVSRIGYVIPFLQKYLITSTIQDVDARRFHFPPCLTVNSSAYRVGRPNILPCSFKNLKIIPDSARSLLPAVFTAQYVAEQLRR